MSRFLACLALLFFFAPFPVFQQQQLYWNNARADIRLTAIALNEEDPADVQVGDLVFLGGWHLTSKNRHFGGISSMLVRGKGRVLMLSDAGRMFAFTLPHHENLEEMRDIPMQVRLLPDLAGPEWDKSRRDSESLVFDPSTGSQGTGRHWVGFENDNSIARYDAAFTRMEARASPGAMRHWPRNGGAEAMLRLSDGRFVLFAEAAFGPDNSHEALLFSKDPLSNDTETRRFGYRSPTGYRVTDAAILPDGRVILVTRRYTFFEGSSAIVMIANPEDIAPGKVWTGREVAKLQPPYSTDNMEAIAVTQEAGHTIIWLASDDNFSSRQRTLLMKFRLETGAVSR